MLFTGGEPLEPKSCDRVLRLNVEHAPIALARAVRVAESTSDLGLEGEQPCVGGMTFAGRTDLAVDFRGVYVCLQHALDGQNAQFNRRLKLHGAQIRVGRTRPIAVGCSLSGTNQQCRGDTARIRHT